MPGDAQNSQRTERDEAMLAVWKQALVEGKTQVTVGGKTFPVRRTPRRHLLEIDFEAAGKALRGLEQNPETKSRWAQLARKGAKVMQFLSAGRYLAVVVDGKITHYSHSE
jgi:hypothetical protein